MYMAWGASCTIIKIPVAIELRRRSVILCTYTFHATPVSAAVAWSAFVLAFCQACTVPTFIGHLLAGMWPFLCSVKLLVIDLFRINPEKHIRLQVGALLSLLRQCKQNNANRSWEHIHEFERCYENERKRPEGREKLQTKWTERLSQEHRRDLRPVLLVPASFSLSSMTSRRRSSTIAATCTGRREFLEVAAKERRPIYSRGGGAVGRWLLSSACDKWSSFLNSWLSFFFIFYWLTPTAIKMIRSSEVSTLSAQCRHFTLNQASKSFLYRSLSFFASVENPFFAFSFKLFHMRPITCNEQLITCSVQQEERNRCKLHQVWGGTE